MKAVGKIFLGIITPLLFIILVLLATIRFEILNKSFLFGVFEKYNIYAQLPSLLAKSIPNDPTLSREEKEGFTEFVKDISPQVIKPLIEDNLTQVIDFLNGRSRDIVISFSLQGIGFENSSGIRWSPSQIPDKNLQQKIQLLNSTGNILIIAEIVVLAILIGLSFLHGKMILLTGGVSVLTVGLIAKLFFILISKNLINGKELSQKILGLLSGSLFSDITTTWLIMGGILILLWIISKIVLRIKSNTK